MEYALASGYYAAQAVLIAREAGDFSRNMLAHYEVLLNNSFILKDFKTFQNAPEVLENPRLFQHYPELIGGIMQDIYQIPDGAKPPLYKTVKKYINFREMLAMAGDLRKVSKI